MARQSTPITRFVCSIERRGPRRATLLCTLMSLTLTATLLAGCAGPAEPTRDARETLGTIVTITAYGDDSDAVLAAIDEAYDAMAAVEVALNVYGTETEPTSGTAAALNASPGEWTLLPAEAKTVLVRTASLGVEEQFSPSLFGVQSLYGFEEGGRIPSSADVMAALGAASGFETREGAEGLEARFATVTAAPLAGATDAQLEPSTAPVGMDFGGAAKGLGLDRAAAVLRGSGAVDGAIISAGSTTIAIGSKPDETPWKIGIEDPRDPESVTAVVQAASDVIVSTSGDYQRYFEADGTRYHHILDPESGMPSAGTRSLTVVGTPSGLDSDILSTALFVMGPDRAQAYAQSEGLGLYVIDDQGQALVTPGPDESYSFDSP